MRSLHLDQTSSQDLSEDPLAFTTSLPSKTFKLEQVIIKATGVITETVTITLDSASGSAYDVVLQEVVLVAEEDFVYRPQGEANFQAGDQIKVQCTDTGGVETVSVIVRTGEISY